MIHDAKDKAEQALEWAADHPWWSAFLAFAGAAVVFRGKKK